MTSPALYTTRSTEVNKAIHKCKVKPELKYCGTVICVCKSSVELKLVCVNNWKLGHFSPFLSMQKAVFQIRTAAAFTEGTKTKSSYAFLTHRC